MPKLSVDTGDLDTTSKKLSKIVSDMGRLDAAVTKLTNSLVKMADKWGSAFGFGQEGSGGGKGSGNTAAPVSALNGPMGRAVGYGAIGEVLAQGAGSINSMMSGVVSGGGGTDVIARQTNAIFGGTSSTLNTVAGFTGIQSASPQDLQQSLATLQANPMLYQAFGSKSQFKNLKGFMNQLRSLNPSMTAAEAAQTANTLASGPALQVLQRLGPQNGQLGQGLVNPRGGINSTNKVFSELLQTLFGGQKLTSQMMRRDSGNSLQATQDWTLINQNNNIPGMGLGLSPEMLTELRQYAAAGGNLTRADKAEYQSPVTSLLSKTTAKTKLTDTQYEVTAGEQNAENRATAATERWVAQLDQANPALGQMVGGFGAVVKGAASAASGLAKFAVIADSLKYLRGGSGLLGGGSGAAGGALSKLLRGGIDPATGSPFSLGGAPIPATGTSAASDVVGGVAGKLGALGAAYAEYQFWKNPKKALEQAGPDPLGIGKGGKVGGWISHEIGWNPKEGIGKNITSSFAKDWDKLWSWGDPLPGMGDPTGATGTQGMSPSLARGISAMRAANPNIQISSGHRTTAQQALLYALKGGKGVAPPGQSKHQSGQAADLGPPSQFGWIAKNAGKFGLTRPAPGSEPWHVETMGDVGTSLVNTFIGQVNSLGTNFGLGSPGSITTSVKPYSGGGGSSNTNSTPSATTSSNSSLGSLSGVLPWTGTDKSINSPTQFSQALLSALGLKQSAQDVQNINAWQQHEGQWSSPGPSNPYYAMNMHNPLNTEGAFSSDAVKLKGTVAYPTWAEGVNVTKKYIEQGIMAPIFSALKSNANLASFSKALEGTGWAGGHYGYESFTAPSGAYAVGDPDYARMGDAISTGTRSMPTMSANARGAGNYFNINAPITLAGTATPQDAQSFVRMILSELKSQTGLDLVSNS
jgi:hypothetical protein